MFPGERGPLVLTTIIQFIWHPAQIAAGVVAKDGSAKYFGPARATPFLCLVVHQPPRRRRARTADQGGAGSSRARQHQDDGGHLRASVPAQ